MKTKLFDKPNLDGKKSVSYKSTDQETDYSDEIGEEYNNSYRVPQPSKYSAHFTHTMEEEGAGDCCTDTNCKCTIL